MNIPKISKFLTSNIQKIIVARGFHASCRKLRNDDNFREQLLTYKGGSIDLLKQDNGIAVLKINNENKRNALSGKMMVDFSDAVKDLESWQEGRGLIVCGAGKYFCSGGDLETVKNICDSVTGYKMSHFMHNTLNKMLNLPLISLALIQGSALGGGAEISTACDFRLMTENASIGFVQVKMGVVTGWGGGTRLVKLIGRRNALKILSSASVLKPAECLRVGLVEEILPDGDDVLDLAVKWIRTYCDKETEILRTMKSIVSSADNEPLDVALEKERKLFSSVWGGEHQQNALKKNIKHE